MGLTNNMIAEFVKIVNNDNKKTSTETTVNGTVVTYDGRKFVRIDGSDALTPVTPTVSMDDGDRVQVLIKDHTATATGNVSDPAASSKTVEKQGSRISEFEIVMAYKVTTDDLEVVNASIENLKATAATLKDADIINAKIESLEATFANAEYLTATDIEAITAEIETIQATFGTFEDISTEDLEAVNAEITNLKGYTADFTYLNVGVLEAIQANIKQLNADKLDVNWANIDFTNIDIATIGQLFTEAGIIKDLTTESGTVTGELVGVTIKGDLIEGNTIKADKLVVKGNDGLYYKLNFEGGNFTEGEEVPTDGLHGSVIVANSITAEKISVSDLVAFGATIAGFKMVGKDLENNKPGAIYSGSKESIDNTTEGIYLSDDGQAHIGNTNNFFKFYKDEEGIYHLQISVDSLVFGGTGKSVESELDSLQQGVDNNQTSANDSASKIENLRALLSQIVTDGNGQSLMVETEESYELTSEVIDSVDGISLDGVTTTTGETVYHGVTTDDTEIYYSIVDSVYYKVTYNPATCTFNISDLEDAINSANSNITDLAGKVTSVDSVVSSIQQTVDDLSIIGGYVVIDDEMEVRDDSGEVVETVPAIILGKSDSDFKVIITNKQIAFSEGSVTPAYISGQTFVAQNIEVKQNLTQGGFAWVTHGGNYGLLWQGYNCAVNYDLSEHIISSNESTTVAAASSFTTTLSATSGYKLNKVTVFMDGRNITSDAFDLIDTIYIDEVIGDIAIYTEETTVEITNLWSFYSRTPADENIDPTTYSKVIDMSQDTIYRAWNDSSSLAAFITADNEVSMQFYEDRTGIELLFELEAGATYTFTCVVDDYQGSTVSIYNRYIDTFETAYLAADKADVNGNLSITFEPTADNSTCYTAIMLGTDGVYEISYSNIKLVKN